MRRTRAMVPKVLTPEVEITIPIPEGYKNNFETLMRAADNGDVALLSCRDRKTHRPVMVICAVNRGRTDVELVPMAKLFDDNPYEEVEPPELAKAA